MCVLIVTASMRQPPLNCSIQGLELLSDVLFHSQYEELKRKLEIVAEPFPSQLVYVNMVAARVLTILMHFRLSVVSQSQDRRGKFITWTLVMPLPMIRRNYFKKSVADWAKIDSNANHLETNDKEEVIDNEKMSQIQLRKNYI